MKLRCIFLSLILLAALALPAAGTEAQADIPASALALVARWEDEGYPDTVGGVWVNEPSSTLVVAVVDGNQAAINSIIASAGNADGLAFASCRWSRTQLLEVHTALSQLVGAEGSPVLGVGLGNRGNDFSLDGEPCVQVTITTLDGQEAAEACADRIREEYGDMVEVSVGPHQISFTIGMHAPTLPQPLIPNRQSQPHLICYLLSLLLVLFLAFPLRWLLLQPAGRPPVSGGPRPMTRRHAAQAVRESSVLPSPAVWSAIQRELEP